MRVKLEKKSLSPNLDKYLEEFGHLPPSHLFRTKTLQDLDEMAEVALFKNKPIKLWEKWKDKTLINFL